VNQSRHSSKVAAVASFIYTFRTLRDKYA